VDTTDETATAGQILLGATAYVNEQKVTGTLIDVRSDPDFVAANIKKGVDIGGVVGSLEDANFMIAGNNETYQDLSFLSNGDAIYYKRREALINASGTIRVRFSLTSPSEGNWVYGEYIKTEFQLALSVHCGRVAIQFLWRTLMLLRKILYNYILKELLVTIVTNL
jgi:hypothetical protein